MLAIFPQCCQFLSWLSSWLGWKSRKLVEKQKPRTNKNFANIFFVFFETRMDPVLHFLGKSAKNLTSCDPIFSPSSQRAYTFNRPYWVKRPRFRQLSNPHVAATNHDVVSSGFWRSKIFPATNSSEIGNLDNIVFIISNDRPSSMSSYVNFRNFFLE